jgi:hypothetical protein
MKGGCLDADFSWLSYISSGISWLLQVKSSRYSVVPLFEYLSADWLFYCQIFMFFLSPIRKIVSRYSSSHWLVHGTHYIWICQQQLDCRMFLCCSQSIVPRTRRVPLWIQPVCFGHPVVPVVIYVYIYIYIYDILKLLWYWHVTLLRSLYLSTRENPKHFGLTL